MSMHKNTVLLNICHMLQGLRMYTAAEQVLRVPINPDIVLLVFK